MGQLTSLHLNNGEDTPVSHEFTPTHKDGMIVRWQDADAALSVALKPKMSISMRPGRLNLQKGLLNGRKDTTSVKRKVTVKLTVPYQPVKVDAVTPAIENAEAVLTFMLPEDAPISVLDDTVAFIQFCMHRPNIVDAVKFGEFPY